MEKIVLEEGKDMTVVRFIEWLNERFKKKNSKPFNAQDAYGYLKRGNIPVEYGFWKLKVTEYPVIGVKMVTVIDLNEKRNERN